MLQKIRGTQDFLDLTLFSFIIKAFENLARTHRFTPIATPILEPTILFKRSLGQETDVVSKEMFIVSNESSSEEICLRPEATASTARAFLEHNITALPWKVFSWGPMFRYERPQKGRYRQFHQINIETIGADNVGYDVQLLALLNHFFTETLHLEAIALTINYLGCPEDRAAYKKILYQFLEQHSASICGQCTVRKEKNILRVLDCKQESCHTLYKKAPVITDHLCAGCAQEWKTLQEELQLLSVSYSHVPTLVRGLDYYDKTVFEFVSPQLGAQNAFCSGGRYNHLMSQVGASQETPSIGAAIGIERLLLLTEPIAAKLLLPLPPRLHAVIPVEESQNQLALLISQAMLHAGLCTETIFDGSSIKSKMKRANRLEAGIAILIGEQEQQNRTATVKNMMTGIEATIPQIELVTYLKNLG